jgi:hypothetical protein
LISTSSVTHFKIQQVSSLCAQKTYTIVDIEEEDWFLIFVLHLAGELLFASRRRNESTGGSADPFGTRALAHRTHIARRAPLVFSLLPCCSSLASPTQRRILLASVLYIATFLIAFGSLGLWYWNLARSCRSANCLQATHVDRRSSTAALERQQRRTYRSASRGRFLTAALADSR